MDSFQNNNKESKKSSSFIGLILKIGGGLGGFAALLIAFGYITITTFLSSVELYGVVEFPLGYYKEACIRLINETIDFYSNVDLYLSHWYMIPVIIVVLLIPFIQKPKKDQKKDNGNTKHDSLIRYFVILCQIIVFSVILSTFFLNKIPFNRTGSTIKFEELIFFSISVPVLIALFLYLFFNFSNIEFDFKNLHKTTSGLFFLLFVLLFISIPFGYGSSIYSSVIYPVDIPECDGVNAFRKSSVEGFDKLFLLGQKNESEVFSYVTDWPPRLIFVNSDSIKSITVKYGNYSEMGLRKMRSKKKSSELELEIENAEDVNDDDAKKWKLKKNE